MLQSQAPIRPMYGFQRPNSRWQDSDSDSSVISDRGCRPFTSCKVAPAVATLTCTTSRSPPTSRDLSLFESDIEAPVHYSTTTSTTVSLTSSPVFCLKRQTSNGIQFVCPKPKRGDSTESSRSKRWSACTPPPKECTLNWSDSDEDERISDEDEFDENDHTDEDDDDDDLDDANSVLYRRLMRRHSSVREHEIPEILVRYDEEEEPMFEQDL